jgi:hypothetical protein
MAKATKTPVNLDNEQSRLFIQAARELGCDEDPAHFDEILKKVARHKPPRSQNRGNRRQNPGANPYARITQVLGAAEPVYGPA